MKFLVGFALLSYISSAWAGSCEGHCNEAYDPDYECGCSVVCWTYRDCCDDYGEVCYNTDKGVSDDDLIEFSEKLASIDQVTFTPYVHLNYQTHVSPGSSDKSNNTLLSTSDFDHVVSAHPTVRALISLFDNYIADFLEAEDRTEEEIQEENNFIDAVMDTTVLQVTYKFLKEKDVFPGTYDQFGEFLKQIWFDLFAKGAWNDFGILNSCGFENVFVGEVEYEIIDGQHNWIRFYLLEQAKQINYHGYISYVEFSNFAKEIAPVYKWNGVMKYVGQSFVGTTPEFEIAIYTLCYMTRGIKGAGSKDCILSFYDQKINVVTLSSNYNGKEHINTAYPEEFPY